MKYQVTSPAMTLNTIIAIRICIQNRNQFMGRRGIGGLDWDSALAVLGGTWVASVAVGGREVMISGSLPVEGRLAAAQGVLSALAHSVQQG
jgi:hypothetical protein